jgi:hypothetical protein
MNIKSCNSRLLLFVLLTATSIGYSQEIDFDRWEVGIDLLPLINKNTIPPSLFAKRLSLKQKQRSFGYVRRGIRTRLGFDINNPDLLIPYRNESYRVVFRPGYEWQVRLKSIDISYGLDLIGQYEKVHLENSSVVDPIVLEYRFAILGLAPVVGLSYKVVKNIRLSIESNIEVAYTNSKYIDVLATETRSENGLRIRANPIYVLNASFVF